MGAAVRAALAARVAGSRTGWAVHRRFPGRTVAQAAGAAAQDRSRPVRAGVCYRSAGPDPRALAVARRGHPPRRGGVRHQASPRVLLRGHADAGRRRRPHRRAVAGAPPAPGRAPAEAARRATLAADRPLRSFRAAGAAAAQRLRAAGRGRRQRIRSAALGVSLQRAVQGSGSAHRCLGDAAGLYGQAAHHAGRRRLQWPAATGKAYRSARNPRPQRAGRACGRRGTGCACD